MNQASLEAVAESLGKNVASDVLHEAAAEVIGRSSRNGPWRWWHWWLSARSSVWWSLHDALRSPPPRAISSRSHPRRPHRPPSPPRPKPTHESTCSNPGSVGVERGKAGTFDGPCRRSHGTEIVRIPWNFDGGPVMLRQRSPTVLSGTLRRRRVVLGELAGEALEHRPATGGRSPSRRLSGVCERPSVARPAAGAGSCSP